MNKAELFLKRTLGEDFLESLNKVELWKPGTKSTVDHEELKTALQIVPRTVMALLIRELAPMGIGENKVISLFVDDIADAQVHVTKHERDVYSGEIIANNKKVTEFKFRALPGVGLVIMSAFELYNMDNLINSPDPNAPLPEESSVKLQRMIDERLSLHTLIGQVVDKKIMEREAIHQMVLSKLTEAMSMIEKRTSDAMAMAGSAIDSAAHAHSRISSQKKKERPLQKFLEERKKPKEFSIQMAKSESVSCPDCRKSIFDGKVFSGCICLGDDMEKKIYIKKSEDGVKIRFGRGWDSENMEMLLDILQKKNK